MKWVDDLYSQTKRVWEDEKDPKGFAIFYSPVKINPKIAIIGYNPGGDESSFSLLKIGVPESHDYFAEKSYKLATKMRYIFKAAGMEEVLRESVKFNLFFFRSRQAKDVRNKNLIYYCKEQVKIIIDHLQPKHIVVEGFQTFKEIKKITGINNENPEYSNRTSKCLMVTGETESNIPLIGLRHPSGARGLSNEDLEEMGELLKHHIRL